MRGDVGEATPLPCRLAVEPARRSGSVEIVPRWEWRTFGEDFGAAEDGVRGARRRSASRRATSCTCSRGSDASVKVRDGLMDVKAPAGRRRQRARAVGAGRRSARSRSPRADVGAVLAGLRRRRARARPRGLQAGRAPRRGRARRATRCWPSTCTSGARTTPSAAAWPSSARSAPMQGSTRSIAIESEDPARVLAAVRALGLGVARERVHGAAG